MTALRTALFAIGLTGAASLLAVPRAQAADDTASLRLRIASLWHVTLVEKDLTTQVVPLVATPDRPVAMRDLSTANQAACLQAIVIAFQAYPAPFISTLVQKVALADHISVWKIDVGGFHAPGLIALNCQDAADNQAFDRDSLHDELAALLLATTPVDRTGWQAFNPPGFRYGDIESYRAELRDPHGRAGDDALHHDGFVSALGLTGLENDFQTYAERILGHPQEFAELLREQPAMRGKARMVMALYLHQAPALAAQFASSGLTDAAQAR
ncbi:hypothetical protein ACELLULO517_12345 [Acidisoma cellulosilytica]|uniref:Uncharacterized protein n=1 Tax=Acidisoma cellulosilyticum TaxID=2802395 RepID=A0A964E488_9PROT|nr:hypothetical protein [Acidisoma cellulosilyticum]MCB8881027.1 hypothetical protein [Acidisoma cellulosilyticum]